MGWRKTVRWLLSGVSALIAVALAANIEKLMEIRGWDTLLAAQLAAKGGLTAIILSPWCLGLAIAVLGFTAGLWVDSALAKIDGRPRPPDKYVELGRDAVALARACNAAVGSYIRQDASGLLAQIMSMMIRFRKLGLPIPKSPPAVTPDANPALTIAGRFFMVVGTLLSNGQIEEARRVATDISSVEPEVTHSDGL